MPQDERRDALAARRRVDEIFGDVLPETTSDERAEGGQDRETPDSWYLENRPPHHDR
jgi:hypothetical protein